MHYTSYMEDCCTSLTERRDSPSDHLIISFVGIQVLQRKISDTFCYHDISECGIRGERTLQTTIDSFSRDIDELKKTFGSRNRNAILVQQLHFLEVWTYEVSLYNELWQSTFVTARPNQFENCQSKQFSVQRTNMLWKIVAATVLFHNWCLSVESPELLRFPFCWWSVHSYVVIVQVKTVFLDLTAGMMGGEEINTGNNDQAESLVADFRRAAEKEVSISHMLNVYMGKLTTITTQLVDEAGARDMPYNYGVLLKSIQSGYERRIGAESRPASEHFETHQNQSSSSELLHVQLENTGTQEPMQSEDSINQVELGIGDPDWQFDIAESGFEDMVWGTMMNDFSFFKPQNGT